MWKKEVGNQEECQKRWKKEVGNQEEIKSKERAWSARFCSLKKTVAKMVSRCEMVSQPPILFCEKTPWHTSAISQPSTPVSQLRNGCELSTPWDPPFRSRSAISKGVSQLRNHSLAHECHLAAPYTHFAATKWLRNLHALKSFSAHTMKPYPHFGNCWTHFDHFLKSISCIPYVNSNIGKSGVQSFKRYVI